MEGGKRLMNRLGSYGDATPSGVWQAKEKENCGKLNVQKIENATKGASVTGKI